MCSIRPKWRRNWRGRVGEGFEDRLRELSRGSNDNESEVVTNRTAGLLFYWYAFLLHPLQHVAGGLAGHDDHIQVEVGMSQCPPHFEDGGVQRRAHALALDASRVQLGKPWPTGQEHVMQGARRAITCLSSSSRRPTVPHTDHRLHPLLLLLSARPVGARLPATAETGGCIGGSASTCIRTGTRRGLADRAGASALQ